MFAIEAIPLNQTILRTLEHPWSRVFMKLFSTFDAKTVLYCQYYTNFMPIEHLARLGKVNFVKALQHHSCDLLHALY